MNPAALAGLFRQHKAAVLGTAAAGVAGLALLSKKKKPAGAGTIPVGSTDGTGVTYATPATTPDFGGTPGTSAADIYNMLNDQLQAAIRQPTTPIPVSASPAAATMYAPSASKQFVRYGDGSIEQVQGDGSLYHVNQNEWQSILKSYGVKNPPKVASVGAQKPPSNYTVASNLAATSNKFGLGK